MVICDCFAKEAEELLYSFNKIKFAKLYAVNLLRHPAQDNALFTLQKTFTGKQQQLGCEQVISGGGRASVEQF